MGEIEAACVDARDALSLVTDVEHTSHLDRIEDLSARGRIAGSRAADALGHEVRLTRLDHGLPIRQASG